VWRGGDVGTCCDDEDKAFSSLSISTLGLRRTIVTIQFSDATVDLLVWADGGGTIVFSVQDAGRCFHLDFRAVQRSEWLAIDSIPSTRIRQITHVLR
jgi:hypothetical protein